MLDAISATGLINASLRVPKYIKRGIQNVRLMVIALEQ
jgi:hypothetical protein